MSNDNKIFVVKKISNKKAGNGITIMTISINTAIGRPKGFNFSGSDIWLANVFVKFMTSPNNNSFKKNLYKSVPYFFIFLCVLEARMMPIYSFQSLVLSKEFFVKIS